ncbi:Ferroporti-1 [Dendryphion nanum]|uniref:Solute carrier family 40 member n=1 Tax=Dendryphion nanum TaxID=256645 RepID=A0A9P9EIP9_9PLEO|nr:Ferroporti-1 [Dendryphion nanum]
MPEERVNNGTPVARTTAHHENEKSARSILWRLYISHTLSTWNARMFEFGAVIFLATIFPQTLFYTSLYALFRSATATLLSSWIGTLVDCTNRLTVVRHSIVYQRCSVACSCLILHVLLQRKEQRSVTLACFAVAVGLACLEKLAFIANTISIERDWIIVVSDALGSERQDLNSSMRRIDLVCKLLAPLCISLVDGYSTKVAIWVVFGLNATSVLVEYFAIAQVFSAVPTLGQRHTPTRAAAQPPHGSMQETRTNVLAYLASLLKPWNEYFRNPAFLVSLALSLLYLTVLSFASQMTTYLLTLGYTSFHVSTMRLLAVILELSATCAAPVLISRIGAVRAGLWFSQEQLLTSALAVGLYSAIGVHSKIAGAALAVGIALSRIGLWGFDLCAQFLIQDNVPEASRGKFSANEAALQNLFELGSFAITMIFPRPEQFKIPVYVSVGAITISAIIFAGFVRKKRGHLLHTSRCFKRQGKLRYTVLPTIEEEDELEETAQE